MRQEPGTDQVDLTDADEVVTAMSIAVERLRQLAAAAFNPAGPDTAIDRAAPQGDR